MDVNLTVFAFVYHMVQNDDILIIYCIVLTFLQQDNKIVHVYTIFIKALFCRNNNIMNRICYICRNGCCSSYRPCAVDEIHQKQDDTTQIFCLLYYATAMVIINRQTKATVASISGTITATRV